jgi:hypothetical protein
MAGFKATPLSDFYAKGMIRPDGRYAHDMYLLQVKTPAESKKAWDYFKVLKTLPGDQVFTTKRASALCGSRRPALRKGSRAAAWSPVSPALRHLSRYCMKRSIQATAHPGLKSRLIRTRASRTSP